MEGSFKKEIPQEKSYFMISYLLDTSIIIDYLRGKPTVVDLLDNIKGDLYSSYICLAELYEGINRVKNVDKMEQAVIKFFASLSGIYGVDGDIARKFGEIRADLKNKGNVIEDLDIMIAVTCLTNDLTLLTQNRKHFERIDNLNIHS